MTAKIDFDSNSVHAQTLRGKHTLDQLKVDELGLVAAITDDQIGSKLMAMGIRPGSQITIIRKAPLGSGFYVKVNSKHFIAIRKQEAACIVLK